MRIFLFRKRNLLLAALALMVSVFAVTALISNKNIAVSNTFQDRELPIYRVCRDDNKMSISFDAAWGNEDTQEIIDILAKYNVKATFFVVGDWVDKYPESVKALSDAGHEVMNHSDTHPYMTSLSSAEILEEANACSDKIEKITGVRPILLRPPYGDYNNNVISTLSENGYYCIQWDVDSLDWKDLSADEITDRVMKNVGSGSIVLFHNAALHTPEALPGIIESLQGKGLEIVKISELIYRDGYKMNGNGEQYIEEQASSEIHM